MLLRSLTKHVKDQNWFAVALDFFIVVSGILIAFQITNWNEAKSNKVGLISSLERLDKEVAVNLEISSNILEIFEQDRGDLRFARDALSKCEASPEATAALERTLFDLVDDFHPDFVVVVLDQLARQDRYQDLLSPEFQQEFGFYTRRIKEEHEQLTNHYNNAWNYHIIHHPSVSAIFVGNEAAEWGFSLAKPFEEVCQDTTFRNRFIHTIGFLSSINSNLQTLNSEIEEFQVSLAKELETTK